MEKRESKWTEPIAEAILSVEEEKGRSKAHRRAIQEWLKTNRPDVFHSVKTPIRTIQSYLQKEKYGFISVFGKEEGKGYYTFDNNATDAPTIQFVVKRFNEPLRPIDLRFSVQLISGVIRVHVAPKGGKHNTEWPLGIATLFTNLREQNLTVRRVLWWSRTARMKPDDSMRTLPISWPDDFDNLGSEEFRKKIGRELKSLKGGWEGAILVEVGMPDPNLSMMETVQLIGGQIRVSEKIRTRAKMQKYESKTQNRIQKLMKKIANKKGTDQLITSIRREEQNDLRKAIFGSRKENPEIECAMCGRSFPNHGDFIVCAHIKRRSDATEEERLNPLIVAPMCKFGCDALFEAGAIIVDSNGVIQINENVARKTSDLFSAADELVGKSCTRYVDGNEDFFAHHRDRFDFH